MSATPKARPVRPGQDSPSDAERGERSAADLIPSAEIDPLVVSAYVEWCCDCAECCCDPDGRTPRRSG